MLSALRESTKQTALARSESRANGPFLCPECCGEVVLRTGSVRMNHFAHKFPRTCAYAGGESDAHRRCKVEIYEALLEEPSVTKVALERRSGTNRPDISAYINGVPVAIEVQISALSLETIIYRTEEYARKGIYVLWLTQWTPYLESSRYSPRLWEKWLHAAHFGSVYYWTSGLDVASYRFEPHLKRIPKSTWRASNGRRMRTGGYTHQSPRYRIPRFENTLNLVRDFRPKERQAWSSKRLRIPPSKLWMN